MNMESIFEISYEKDQPWKRVHLWNGLDHWQYDWEEAFTWLNDTSAHSSRNSRGILKTKHVFKNGDMWILVLNIIIVW